MYTPTPTHEKRTRTDRPVIPRPSSHLAVRVGEECMARERRDEVDKREEGEGGEERGEVGREGSEPGVKGVGGHGVCKTRALAKVMVIT